MALRCAAMLLWALLLPHPSAATPVRAVWSPAHNDTSCERSPTARLPPVPACSLAQCKQHCESAANCHFINHAPGNLACELYSSCDQPWCRQIAPGGGSTWWNAYQLTSPNATAFPPCAAPIAAAPSDHRRRVVSCGAGLDREDQALLVRSEPHGPRL